MTTFEEKIVGKYFDKVDQVITKWMGENGLVILRISLGIVFFWFGVLKFFPGLSPAENLVRNTVYFINPDIFIPLLAMWETLIGIGLITGKYMRITLLLLFLQMPGTALPLVVYLMLFGPNFPMDLHLKDNT